MSVPNPPTGTPGAATASDPTPVGFAPAPSSNGTAASAETDWTDQVTDLVVDVVDKVRDRTTGQILKGSRAVVYGVVALIVAIPLLVVGIILIGRLLELIPGDIWIPYTVLGAVLVLVGLILWRKRRPSSV